MSINMTEQEAIDLLRFAYPKEFTKPITEKVISMAVEALEKQIPKDIFHYDWNGIDGVPYDLCPNCKNNLCTSGLFGRSKKYINYCSNCGQAIKWESEE